MRWSLPFFPLTLVLLEVAAYCSNDMYLPALPQMTKDLHLSLSHAQLTVTLWFLGVTIMPLAAGPLSEQFGRRNTLLIGTLCYILTNFICFSVTNDAVFLFTRFLQGLSIAVIVNAGYASIHESFNQIEALKILGIMGSITIIAPALGPLFGAWILLITDWRGIFLAAAIASIIPGILLYYIMPETLPKEKRKPNDLAKLAKEYFSILSNSRFLTFNITTGLMFGGFLVWVTSGPLLVIEHFQFKPTEFGLLQGFVFLFYIAGLNVIRILLRKEKNIYSITQLGIFTVFSASAMMFAGVYFFETSLLAFLIPMIVYAFGSGLCFAPLNRLGVESSNAPMAMRVACGSLISTGIGTACTFASGMLFQQNTRSLAEIIIVCGVSAIVLYTVMRSGLKNHFEVD